MPALVNALREALAGFPAGAPALVDAGGTLSASTLLDQVARESRWLASCGAQRFGLLADNGRGWAIADLALLAAGRPCIPLPQHFGPGQLRHALDSAGVDAVLSDEPRRLLELEAGFVVRGHGAGTGLALLMRDREQQAPVILPPGTLKVTYTSGSTAEPKGVCLGDATLAAVATSIASVGRRLGLRRHLCLLPLATLLENVAGLHAAWLAGACCDLGAGAAGAIARGSLTPGILLGEIDRAAPESMILVPELLRILEAAATRGWTAAEAKFIAVGGARVAPELLERATAAGLPVFEGYGLSECGSVVSLNLPGASRPGTAGQPLPHAEVRVDEHGEIHVAGSVMAGYVGGTASTTEIATGDLGELDEAGYLHISGRIKNLLITSLGRNLSPEWIESELCAEPAIGQAVVFGEARERLVALLAPARADVPAAAVAAAVGRANLRLPGYARISRHHLLREPLTAAAGLLTANGRPRRERILACHGDLIDALYLEDQRARLPA
ncbi:MAG: long-chain acyl-CoA synthetase [Gammaproteobacteria bacterium]|nr:long-chain acyl-CoA synthetase [Gammaproteobacteria bacterium]MDL1881501.1 long-chain fatty acid--CoA ligase [Gammaproteobacteria bacterium PRO2]GIK34812.1 MAG: long-chain acyl-CoA synthetase [Gammaproteobacteria bacterium]